MKTETTTLSGEPAIRVLLDYNEAREYLARNDERIAVMDAITESEREELSLNLYLSLFHKDAKNAFGERGEQVEDRPLIWFDDDYDEALLTLERIDRGVYLEIVDLIARFIAQKIMSWDTEDVGQLMDLLARLDEVVHRTDQIAEDYIRMDALPTAPIPEEVDTGYPVWAVDKHGLALVGATADEVMTIEEVQEVCEEYASRMARRRRNS